MRISKSSFRREIELRGIRESTPRRLLEGAGLSIAIIVALSGVMVPIRGSLAMVTPALLLTIPVVIGAMIGGLGAGITAAITGVLAYDVLFLPPYDTLSVQGTRNVIALAVYGVVMVVMARVVSQMSIARREAQLHASKLRRLFDLSELLVRGASQVDLLEAIVTAVRQAFELEGAALLLPAGDGLKLVASSGTPLSDFELQQLSAEVGIPVSLGIGTAERHGVQVVVLTVSGRAIGLLALRGLPPDEKGDDLLRAFVNHLGLALERAQLNDQAVRVQLLEAVDRLRQSLVGAVSHDLRTPLATIKVSASTLLDRESELAMEDRVELLGLIDAQADRLDRLVSNLLDMTRIQSGKLEVRCRLAQVGDLVEEALSILGRSAEVDRVCWHAPSDLPLVNVDHVLVRQVIANLVDNALRYAPRGTDVTISAARHSEERVLVSVTDHGPGIPQDVRPEIFDMGNRREAGGGGGLGLAIARSFLEAHGQRIWVDDSRSGTRICFTLPAAQDEGPIQTDPSAAGRAEMERVGVH